MSHEKLNRKTVKDAAPDGRMQLHVRVPSRLMAEVDLAARERGLNRQAAVILALEAVAAKVGGAR